jgi:hypothetical protein
VFLLAYLTHITLLQHVVGVDPGEHVALHTL